MHSRYWNLTLEILIPFVVQIWKGEYDLGKTEAALSHTLNFTVDGDLRLVGCLHTPYRRLLFWHHHLAFGFAPYQKQGVGLGLYLTSIITRQKG